MTQIISRKAVHWSEGYLSTSKTDGSQVEPIAFALRGAGNWTTRTNTTIQLSLPLRSDALYWMYEQKKSVSAVSFQRCSEASNDLAPSKMHIQSGTGQAGSRADLYLRLIATSYAC